MEPPNRVFIDVLGRKDPRLGNSKCLLSKRPRDLSGQLYLVHVLPI